MATVIYQFQKKLKTEGITDLTLFNEQIPFDAREPDLIVEEDSYILHDTSPAVNYQEVMEDFAMRCYLSKPDLAMSMGETITLVWWTQLLVNICRCNSSNSGSINTIPTVHTVQILWIQISISENQFYFGKITNNKQNC